MNETACRVLTFRSPRDLAAAFTKLLLVVVCFGGGMPSAFAQAPPQLVSVTPVDGATAVSTNSSIVFVFDEDMNTLSPPFGSFATLVGNFSIVPATVQFAGSWGTDKRTLTLMPTRGMPYDTNITWTLNPPGGTLFPPLASAVGVAVPTLSGSFHTEPFVAPSMPPSITSVTPTDNATQVAPTHPLVFVFDQDMDTNVVLSSAAQSTTGNYVVASFGNVPFTVSWTDKRTLTFQPIAPVPLSTTVSWRLNPAGASAPLKGTNGLSLANAGGSYDIITDTGGSVSETCQPSFVAPSYYAVTKSVRYVQLSSSSVLLDPRIPTRFDVALQGPAPFKSGAVGNTNASLVPTITFPNGTANQLLDIFSVFRFYDSPTTEAGLDAIAPPGPYVIHFDVGSGDRGHGTNIPYTVSMTMPPTPSTIPMLANFDESQAIDPAQDFTLHWNSFATQSPEAVVVLTVTDQFGKLIFQAPNPCASRVLSAADSSITIPANRLKPGLNYNGTLQFGIQFYNSTNDVPGLAGTGLVQRATSFQLGTIGSVPFTDPAARSGPLKPPSFIGWQFLSGQGTAGDKAHYILSGTPGATYIVLRSTSLGASQVRGADPNWSATATVTMDTTGQASFEEPDSTRGSTSASSVFFTIITK